MTFNKIEAAMQYRFITVFMFLVIAIFTTNTIHSQGFVSESQLRHLLAEEEGESSLTGIWLSEGYTVVRNVYTEEVNKLEPIYDFFTMVPEGDKYRIAANRETENPKMYAAIEMTHKYNGHYISSVNTDEPISAPCTYTVNAEGFESIHYSYRLPPKLNYKLVQNDSLELGYSVTLYKIETEKYYTEDKETQADLRELFENEIINKELSKEELQGIEETLYNPPADTIRYLMDTGNIKHIIGASEFPNAIKDDRFFIITVNNAFTNRVTYTVLFENFDDNVWHFDFKVDDNFKMLDLICVDKAHEYSAELIALIKDHNTKSNTWRK